MLHGAGALVFTLGLFRFWTTFITNLYTAAASSISCERSFIFSHAVAVTVGENSGIIVDLDLETKYVKTILWGAHKTGELLEKAELDYSLTPGSVFTSTWKQNRCLVFLKRRQLLQMLKDTLLISSRNISWNWPSLVLRVEGRISLTKPGTH